MKWTEEHKESYRVPEGYFESIKNDLKKIPQEQKSAKVIQIRAGWKYAIAAAATLIIALSIFWPRTDRPETLLHEDELALYLAEDAYVDYYSSDVVDAYLDWSEGQEISYEENAEVDYLSDHYSLNEILTVY